MAARGEIPEAQWRALDRARARRIYLYSAIAASLVTLVLYVL